MTPVSSSAPSFAVRRSEQRDWLESRGFAILGWLIAFGYLLLEVLAGFTRPLGAFDDCIPLVSATLINHGHRPVADFYSIYPPFLDYFYAIAFRLVGSTVMVPRLLSSALYIVVSLKAAGFLKKRVPSFRPLMGLVTLWAAVSLLGISHLPVWPAYAFSVLAIFAYLALEKPDSLSTSRQLFFCASLAGVSLAMRLNFGMYAAAALSAYTCLRIWTSDLPKPGKRSRTLAVISSLVLGAALPSIVLYGCIYRADAASTFAAIIASTRAALPARFIVPSLAQITELLLFPFFWWVLPDIIEKNKLSTASLITGFTGAGLLLIAIAERRSLLLPYVIPGLTFSAFVFLGLWRKRLNPSHLLFVLFYAGLLHYYLSRAELQHAEPLFALQGLMLIPLLVPARFQITENPGSVGLRGAALAILLVAIWLSGIDFGPLPDRDVAARGVSLIADWIRHPKVSDSDRVQNASGPWQAVLSSNHTRFEAGEPEAIKFVVTHTAPSDLIFVGSQDNSSIWATDLRLYWLTGRQPGVRYYQADPGVSTSDAIQERVINDLENNHVNWVILQDEQGEGEPSFVARVQSQSKRLDDFLKTHVHEVERFDRFSILMRR